MKVLTFDVVYILSFLILFLYSLKTTTLTLSKISNAKIKLLLMFATKTNFSAFILGVITTALCQSSNAITIITLTLVSSNYISFKKGVFIIIGSNIGTTFTSFLFSLNLFYFIPVILIIGFILSNINKHKEKGVILLSLGFVFFSLELLINKLESFVSTEYIYPFIDVFNNSSFLSFLGGTFFSAFIQSSNATIAITQGLYSKEVLSLCSGIALMLGANIGTTITGVITSFACSKDTKKVAFINFWFNFFGSVLFLFFLTPYVNLIKLLSSVFNLNKQAIIALSHFIYNLICAFVFYILYNRLEKEL